LVKSFGPSPGALPPLILTHFFLAAASGENTPLNLPAEAPKHVQSASASGSLVRTIVGLAVVIGVIYGVAWMLRQVKSSKEQRSAGTGLSSEATLALGPNRALHLVRAGNELVLVGVAENGVTPLRTYTQEEALASGLIEAGDDADVIDVRESAPRPAIAAALGAGQLVDRLRALTVR
jgi:flagellar protein FliO/FliZ